MAAAGGSSPGKLRENNHAGTPRFKAVMDSAWVRELQAKRGCLYVGKVVMDLFNEEYPSMLPVADAILDRGLSLPYHDAREAKRHGR